MLQVVLAGKKKPKTNVQNAKANYVQMYIDIAKAIKTNPNAQKCILDIMENTLQLLENQQLQAKVCISSKENACFVAVADTIAKYFQTIPAKMKSDNCINSIFTGIWQRYNTQLRNTTNSVEALTKFANSTDINNKKPELEKTVEKAEMQIIETPTPDSTPVNLKFVIVLKKLRVAARGNIKCGKTEIIRLTKVLEDQYRALHNCKSDECYEFAASQIRLGFSAEDGKLSRAKCEEIKEIRDMLKRGFNHSDSELIKALQDFESVHIAMPTEQTVNEIFHGRVPYIKNIKYLNE